jgi:acetyltransferase-like isoleucine patch superfamily enzyme
MNKLTMLVDDSGYAQSAQKLAVSNGYELDVIEIYNSGLEDSIAEDLFDSLAGKDVFIAADQRYLNMLRMNYLKMLTLKKANLINLIDVNTPIPNKIKLGKNIYIGKDVVLGSNLRIEDGVILDDGSVVHPNSCCQKGVYIGAKSVIGPNAFIGPNTVVGSNITLGGITVGSRCKVLNHGRYEKNLGASTYFIENNLEPIIFHENPIEETI